MHATFDKISLQLLALLLVICRLGVSLDALRDDPQIKLVKVDSNNMKYWYDPISLCMVTGRTSDGVSLLNTSPTLTFYQTLMKCRENSTKLDGSPFNLLQTSLCPDGLCTLPSSTFANRVRGWCCTEDLPFTERGFDMIAEGFDQPLGHPVLDILTELSRRNMSLVFLGDSMNGQIFSAFEQERRREEVLLGNDDRIAPLDSEPTDQLWWARDGLHGISRKTLRHLPTRTIWAPEDLSNRNKVYIYGISSNDLSSPEDDEIMNAVLPLLSRIEHPGGILFIGNIGHHLASLRSHATPVVMNEKMGHVLEMFDRAARANAFNIFAFRETTPSHFNAPDLSGSFEKWERSTNKNYNFSAPNDWDKTLYWCRAISNSSSHLSHFRENEAVKLILNFWNEVNVHFLPTFRYLAPFYKMKYGHCGGYSRIDVLDCVHLCGFSPTMWYPIWFHMLNITRSSKSVPTIVDKSILYVKNNSEPKVLYVFQHGLLHKVENEACLENFNGFNRSNSVVKIVSTDEFESIPLGASCGEGRTKNIFSVSNNTLIKLPRGREIFIVIDGKKRSIPNFDTFVAMRLDLSKVVSVNLEEMNSVPTGLPMPILS